VLRCAPQQRALIATLLQKRDELLRMQQMIANLQGMEAGAAPAPPPVVEEKKPTPIVVEKKPVPAAEEADGQDDMVETIKMLREKQAELMRMREAISDLRSGTGTGTQTAPEEDEEEEDDDEDDEEDEDEEDDGAAEEAALVEQLRMKRDELLKMQEAIARLEAAEAEAQAAEAAQGEEDAAEEAEPKTEQEWLERLLKQQEELARLRSAIAAAKAGAELSFQEPTAAAESDLQLHDIDEEEEKEEEGDDDEELQAMLSQLRSKRDELNTLLEMKAQLQERLTANEEQERKDREQQAVLMHREQAQQAVDEQERKIAQLTALQVDLRSRLAAMTDGNEVEEQEEEEQEEEVERTVEDGLAERVLELLATKTDECQRLAAVVEEARAAGMDPTNPRLQLAEHNLATRYQEIKELAAFSNRLGLTMDEEEEEAIDPETEAALMRVQRLQQELDQCVHELRTVDANASPTVARNPAFRKMRAIVVSKLEALHTELTEAREAYKLMCENTALVAKPSTQEEEEPEVDLSIALRDALDKLWQRPYDCRVFTLQLLQSLAQLDNQSLCMMTSCFARYLHNHSVPA